METDLKSALMSVSCFIQQNWTQKRRTVSQLLRSLNQLQQRGGEKDKATCAAVKGNVLARGQVNIIGPFKYWTKRSALLNSSLIVRIIMASIFSK